MFREVACQTGGAAGSAVDVEETLPEPTPKGFDAIPPLALVPVDDVPDSWEDNTQMVPFELPASAGVQEAPQEWP